MTYWAPPKVGGAGWCYPSPRLGEGVAGWMAPPEAGGSRMGSPPLGGEYVDIALCGRLPSWYL